MNTSTELNLGRAGEHIAMADLLLKGEQCYTTGQGVNYDLVVEKGGKMIRLQVKATRKTKILSKHANPIYFFHISHTGKNGKKRYRIGDFEGFALVALDRREVFYLKFNDKIGKDSVCLRDRNADLNKGYRGGRRNGIYLQDLTWENFNK